MNDQFLRTAESAAQYDDADVLDAWLAQLSASELDRFLNGIAERDFVTASALDLPA